MSATHKRILLFVLAAGVLAYLNSFAGVFLFDDEMHLLRNASIRTLWPPWESMLSPLHIERPLVGFSFALNYAMSGLETWSYHLTNLAIHLAAAAALFDLVRRTLLSPRLRERYADRAVWIAGVTALLWVVHPMNVQAVTYVIQRFQSLMGLFYFVTLDAGAAYLLGGSPRWRLVAWIACALGMGSKQDMVTAPLAILAYDSLFVSESVRVAIIKRVRFYGGLAATYLVVALGYWGAGRSIVVGAKPQIGLTPLSYALTQSGVILHYLQNALWPSGLCFDYLWPYAKSFGEVAIPVTVLLALLGFVAWAFFKRRAWSFLGVQFFLGLALSSSFLPIADAAWDYRMYVPLAALLCGAVLLFAELARRRKLDSLALGLAVAAALALGLMTHRLNASYASAESLWREVIRQNPKNPRAHNALGMALERAERYQEAWEHFSKAVELEPRYAEANDSIGRILLLHGKIELAASYLERAVKLAPRWAIPHGRYGYALAMLGRKKEAVEQYRIATSCQGDFAEFEADLGRLLIETGSKDEGLFHLKRATELEPTNLELRKLIEASRAQAEKTFSQSK